jgi:preprotein translocase subunit YajC
MHTLSNILVAAATTTTTHSSKKSSGSTYTLLIIIVLFAGVYLLFIRPRQQRVRQQQTAARQLEVGDQVVTASGLYGRLVSLNTDTDTAEVEVAPGVVISMMRRAVNPRPGASTASTPPRADERGSSAESGDDDLPDDKPDQPS